MHKIKGLKRTTLCIPEDTRIWLKTLGSGSMSEALRILHKRYKITNYPRGRPPKTASNV